MQAAKVHILILSGCMAQAELGVWSWGHVQGLKAMKAMKAMKAIKAMKAMKATKAM